MHLLTVDIEFYFFLCNSEPEVRHHLVRVYACLTATTVCAAVGAFVHLLGIWEAGLISGFGSIGLALYLSLSVEDPKTFYTRLGLLLGFGFLVGNTIGPLLDMVISIEPQVVVTALIGTSVVFISLSCSALLAKRGSFLFLGGIFMSILSLMALFGLANIFIQSQFIYQVSNASRKKSCRSDVITITCFSMKLCRHTYT